MLADSKGDTFKLKYIQSSFVVSVGINLKNLSQFISEWGTLLKAQITVCLCACADMIIENGFIAITLNRSNKISGLFAFGGRGGRMGKGGGGGG